MLPLRASLLLLAALLPIATADSSHDPQIRRRVNCKHLKDGNYVFGCNRYYSMCTNGNEHPMHCYNDLVLDPELNQCLDASDVPICQLHGDTR